VTLPGGYEALDARFGRAFAWAPARPWAERALSEHGTLRAWADSIPDADRLLGRGTVLSMEAPTPGPDGRARWVARRYLRGGAVAPWLGDRYLRGGEPRPWGELRASVSARARGVPTPAVVAGAIYPAGPLHYRADLVTERVPDAMDLAALLFGLAGTSPVDPAAALRASGALIARAAAAGLVHPDVNAKNILLRQGTRGPEAYLIDLDRSRLRSTPRPSTDRAAMKARLERSLEKLAAQTGATLTENLREALERGLRDAGDRAAGIPSRRDDTP
jgi:3-deoxy-D-manno-octulosonic acid kinase